MNEKSITNLAKNYMQIWSSGNEHILDALAHDNISVNYSHFEKPYVGIETYKKLLQMTYGFFPDLRISVMDVIEAGVLATVIWEYSGTHQNGKLFGIEPSGRRVTVAGITILEFKEGKVAAERGVVDNFSMVTQLGALTIEV